MIGPQNTEHQKNNKAMIVSALQAGEMLHSGMVGVIPTESVYGLVASAKNRHAIERVYDVKHRPGHKPCIILIAEASDMKAFGIDDQSIAAAAQYWPGKVSVVVPCHNSTYDYLTRSTESIAFRQAGTAQLQEILSISGPIVAPSANPDTLAPATTIQQAVEYFEDAVDFYVDDGVCNERPSKIVHAQSGHIFRQ